MTNDSQRKAGNAPARILVVEDEEVLRGLLARVLDEENVWCASTGSGEEAIGLLELQEFNLAVVDKNLPDISGLDVARKARDSRPPVPVIIITGYPSMKSMRESESLGVSSYLKKPFDLCRLRAEMTKALESFRMGAAGELLPHERPTKPPPRASGGDSQVRTDVAILILEPDTNILEPDTNIHNAVLAALTNEGCRVLAFQSRRLAEIHAKHMGYDVLIASPEILQETQHWATQVPGEAPLGKIAILDSPADDKKMKALRTGAAAVLVPPFEKSQVMAELRTAIKQMRAERKKKELPQL